MQFVFRKGRFAGDAVELNIILALNPEGSTGVKWMCSAHIGWAECLQFGELADHENVIRLTDTSRYMRNMVAIYFTDRKLSYDNGESANDGSVLTLRGRYPVHSSEILCMT